VVPRGDHGPVDIDRSPGQQVGQQYRRPPDRPNIFVFDRFSQRPQPDPGLVRDKVDAHLVAGRGQAATGQEIGEPVQYDPQLPVRFLGPASVTQHRHHAADRVADICLSHHDHLRIR